MEARLQFLLALAVHPAEIDSEHADAFALHGIGDAAGQGVQRRLRRGIDGEVGRPAVGQHAGNVDDDAATLPAHRLHRFLHQEKGGAGIGVEQPAESIGRGIIQAAPLGVAGGIHQHIEAAKALQSRSHRAGRQTILAKIRRQHMRLAFRQRARRRLQPLGIAVEQHHAREAFSQKSPGRG